MQSCRNIANSQLQTDGRAHIPFVSARRRPDLTGTARFFGGLTQSSVGKPHLYCTLKDSNGEGVREETKTAPRIISAGFDHQGAPLDYSSLRDFVWDACVSTTGLQRDACPLYSILATVCCTTEAVAFWSTLSPKERIADLFFAGARYNFPPRFSQNNPLRATLPPSEPVAAAEKGPHPLLITHAHPRPHPLRDQRQAARCCCCCCYHRCCVRACVRAVPQQPAPPAAIFSKVNPSRETYGGDQKRMPRQPKPADLVLLPPSEHEAAGTGPRSSPIDLQGVDLSSLGGPFAPEADATGAATANSNSNNTSNSNSNSNSKPSPLHPSSSSSSPPLSPRLFDRGPSRNFFGNFKAKRSPPPVEEQQQQRTDTPGSNGAAAHGEELRPGTSSLSKVYHLRKAPGSTPELSLVAGGETHRKTSSERM